MVNVIPGKVCISCGRLTDSYTEFKCPKCAGNTIIRCRHCREVSNVYKCKECNFEGP